MSTDNIDKTKAHDEAWLQQARQQLRAPLPPSVAGQLRAARREALQAKSRQPAWQSYGMALAAGLAALAITLGIIWLPNSASQSSPIMTAARTAPQTQVALEDLSIIAAPDDLQFYQDLDFLLWLEQENKRASKG